MAQWLKNSLANAGDTGSIPGLGKSPGERNGDPLQVWEDPLEKEMATRS